jgi:hypothetical protein
LRDAVFLLASMAEMHNSGAGENQNTIDNCVKNRRLAGCMAFLNANSAATFGLLCRDVV